MYIEFACQLWNAQCEIYNRYTPLVVGTEPQGRAICNVVRGLMIWGICLYQIAILMGIKLAMP